MYKVSSHGIEEIGILINNVLVVEKELVWLQQLLLFHHQLVRVFIVLHDLVILHVVVGDGLSAKHNQGVLVDHVKPH